MDRKTYREAFDQIPFSADFQERTANLLHQCARELEKENKIVNFSKTKKLAVTAAAAVALLIVSVSAALVWLTPAQVAERFGNTLLSEAFEGPDAIVIDETVETGDFAVTLMGLVSGEDLDTLNPDTFFRITGRPDFSQVIDSILSCQAAGIRTKVNTVLLQGVNDGLIVGVAAVLLERGDLQHQSVQQPLRAGQIVVPQLLGQALIGGQGGSAHSAFRGSRKGRCMAASDGETADKGKTAGSVCAVRAGASRGGKKEETAQQIKISSGFWAYI